MQPILFIALGATLLTVVGIAFGGTFILRVLSGRQPANELQKTFFRAGHAHAGVLVTLGLTIGVLTHVAGANDVVAAVGTIAVLTAAIFIPAGFSCRFSGRTPDNRIA